MPLAGNSVNAIRKGRRRYYDNRLLPISALMLTVVLLSVGTNIFLASWILIPLVELQEARQSCDTSATDSEMTHDGNIDRREKKVLHIVTTRFQQLQPHLVELGKARVELFETFCLPTMINQDIQDGFLWFVMTDPNLDPSLMRLLQRLLRPYPHFYLVASNDKLVTPTELVKLNKTKEYVRTGDLDRLYRELFDIHRPLLIETRLDADDGLSGRTLSEIQRMVFEELPTDTRGWQIICSRIHYEWRNNEITMTNNGQDNVDTGRDSTVISETTGMSSGKIRIVRERICVTPGYTLVRHRPKYSIDFPIWPRTGHNLIVIEWPECSTDPNNRTFSYNCWKKLGNFPSAIRSRTITSAGMSRIAPPPKYDMYDNKTQLFWDHVERDFGISESKARSTSEYLRRNLPLILEDNLEGQCTFGHSCKNSSKEKLEELLNLTSHQIST